ncbi:MAG: hypothetical protein RLY21_2236 [Planctomycetota bacterium]|jgi:hypothetical protein
MTHDPASEFLKPLPVRVASLCCACAACVLAFAGCDGGKSTPATAPAASAPAAPASAPAAETPKTAAKDDVKLSKENWPNGKVKYSYEMRKSSNGKWARNGIGRAYYESGELEREGMYKNNVRVGRWTYYKLDGTVSHVEDRGTDGKGATTGEPPLP